MASFQWHVSPRLQCGPLVVRFSNLPSLPVTWLNDGVFFCSFFRCNARRSVGTPTNGGHRCHSKNAEEFFAAVVRASFGVTSGTTSPHLRKIIGRTMDPNPDTRCDVQELLSLIAEHQKAMPQPKPTTFVEEFPNSTEATLHQRRVRLAERRRRRKTKTVPQDSATTSQQQPEPVTSKSRTATANTPSSARETKVKKQRWPAILMQQAKSLQQQIARAAMRRLTKMYVELSVSVWKRKPILE